MLRGVVEDEVGTDLPENRNFDFALPEGGVGGLEPVSHVGEAASLHLGDWRRRFGRNVDAVEVLLAVLLSIGCDLHLVHVVTPWPRARAAVRV